MIETQPLTAEAFKPFGQVITFDGPVIGINQGFAKRFDDLAFVDTSMRGGDTKISLFEANPRPMPIAITLMERHPLGSQAFFPLQNRPWLVLVCDDPRDAKSYRCFTATGQQGVNYNRNVWHHPLLVFDDHSRFIIVDRRGPDNLEEVHLENALYI